MEGLMPIRNKTVKNTTGSFTPVGNASVTQVVVNKTFSTANYSCVNGSIPDYRSKIVDNNDDYRVPWSVENTGYYAKGTSIEIDRSRIMPKRFVTGEYIINDGPGAYTQFIVKGEISGPAWISCMSTGDSPINISIYKDSYDAENLVNTFVVTSNSGVLKEVGTLEIDTSAHNYVIRFNSPGSNSGDFALVTCMNF